MKFVEHAKALKTHVDKANAPEPLVMINTGDSGDGGLATWESKKSYLDSASPKWDKGLAAMSLAIGGSGNAPAQKGVTQYVGGPVGVIDKVSLGIHPANISVAEALDALKYHGVFFKNISMTYGPGFEVEVQASIGAVGDNGHKAIMDLHEWLYSPGKGY